MKLICPLSQTPLWLFLLIFGVFGAERVSGQAPQQSLTHAAAPDRADPSAEPAAYWIFLDGKPDAPPVEISERARARRGQPYATELDKSVSPTYIRILEGLGVQIRAESRWLNAVSAELTQELLARIREMNFVRDIRPLVRRTATFPEPVPGTAPVSKTADHHYGSSRTQLALMNAIEPLERGINGKGVRIGFLDSPFSEFNHTAFDSLKSDNRLIEIRNFTGKTDDTNTHGMQVASLAVGYQEGELIGPAHEAEVLAAITEYTPSETNQEEDNLVAGLEWLESEGADVVNISLGYAEFDSTQNSYAVSDLDGDTGITTIAVDQAAALGVVVVTSAGNEARCGDPALCWYYISTPADADSAIAVGAVASNSSRAVFSSFGPTADGRIKPDVSAMGVAVYLATSTSQFSYRNGTSYSGPLVAAVAAQILQVNPNLSPIDVRDILRMTAHQSASPDNALGWGIVNADAAVKMAESLINPPPPPPSTTANAPENLQATADNAQVTLRWEAPNNDGGADITDYAYRQKESGGNFTAYTDIPESGPGEANARSYTVTGLTNGLEYVFHVQAVNEHGGGLPEEVTVTLPSRVNTESEELPTEVVLWGNYPNPFNPETTIRYALPQAGNIRLAVYDLLGHEVAVLVDEPKPAGHHATRFDAGDLPSGAYVYRLQAQDKIMVQIMMLVK